MAPSIQRLHSLHQSLHGLVQLLAFQARELQRAVSVDPNEEVHVVRKCLHRLERRHQPIEQRRCLTVQTAAKPIMQYVAARPKIDAHFTYEVEGPEAQAPAVVHEEVFHDGGIVRLVVEVEYRAAVPALHELVPRRLAHILDVPVVRVPVALARLLVLLRILWSYVDGVVGVHVVIDDVAHFAGQEVLHAHTEIEACCFCPGPDLRADFVV